MIKQILHKFRHALSKAASDERGATAIEYGLIAALISVVLITVIGLMGANMSDTLNTIAGYL